MIQQEGMNHQCSGLNYPGAHALHHGAQIQDVMSESPTSQQNRCKLLWGRNDSDSSMFKVDGFCVVDSVGGCIEQKPQTSEVDTAP